MTEKRDTSFWQKVKESTVGVVVTTYPTRNGRMRARLEVDGHQLWYTGDYGSLADLFGALSESARKVPP